MNENVPANFILEMKVEILENLLKILQRSQNKPEILKTILDIDKENIQYFENLYNQINSGEMKLNDFIKMLQKKIGEIGKISGKNEKLNKEEELYLISKFDSIMKEFTTQELKIEATQLLSNLMQKSVSKQNLISFSNDNTFKLLNENKVDLDFLKDNLNLIKQFSKILQRKVGENKVIKLSQIQNKIYKINQDFINHFNQNRENFSSFSNKNFEFANISFFTDETIFYVISFVPNEKTFYFNMNNLLNDDFEIPFSQLRHMYEDKYFTDFEFHREEFSEVNFSLKYKLNYKKFIRRLEDDFRDLVPNYKLKIVGIDDNFFKNKMIFSNDSKLFQKKFGDSVLLFDYNISPLSEKNIFKSLKSNADLQLQYLKQENLNFL